MCGVARIFMYQMLLHSKKKYSLRGITNNDLKVPEKPKLKCLGFTYNEA